MTIEPDTKNWTWVLERPCPECGFDAAVIERDDIADLARRCVAGWRQVLDGSPDVTRRPSPDRWSTLEYGCHVRDVFRLGEERLRLMLTEDAPTFANWDQDATAVEDDYARQDPAVVVEELAVAGSRLAARYDAVEGDQWARTGVRSDGSRFTVESFGLYLLHDPVHHLWDVDAPLAT